MDRHDELWAAHPAVPTGKELPVGDRAADMLRAGMGSWPFIFGFLGFMACWMVWNVIALGVLRFDPFPYILLNLGLSTLAGLQGGILLISAKRQDAINAALAEHDRQIMGEIHAMLTELRGNHGD
jgi:uncharacterized membrane protein